MAEQPSTQSERDPNCYCAARGLDYSCAASAGEPCQQPDLGDDLRRIHEAVAKAPRRDVLADMTRTLEDS